MRKSIRDWEDEFGDLNILDQRDVSPLGRSYEPAGGESVIDSLQRRWSADALYGFWNSGSIAKCSGFTAGLGRSGLMSAQSFKRFHSSRWRSPHGFAETYTATPGADSDAQSLFPGWFDRDCDEYPSQYAEREPISFVDATTEQWKKEIGSRQYRDAYCLRERTLNPEKICKFLVWTNDSKELAVVMKMRDFPCDEYGQAVNDQELFGSTYQEKNHEESLTIFQRS